MKRRLDKLTFNPSKAIEVLENQPLVLHNIDILICDNKRF
jgi:hypothetical protein